MSDDATRDELQDVTRQRIFGAYDAMEPDPEAQERMLAHILAEQARRKTASAADAEPAAPAPSGAPAPDEGDASPSEPQTPRNSHRRTLSTSERRRRSVWMVPAVAIAASVLVMAIVFSFSPRMPSEATAARDAHEASQAYLESSTADSSAEQYAPSDVSAQGTSGAEANEGATTGATTSTDGPSGIPTYTITLSSGTTLDVALSDGARVPAIEAGDLVEDATAVAPDGTTRSCQVFRAASSPDTYLVMISGDSGYYLATALD